MGAGAWVARQRVWAAFVSIMLASVAISGCGDDTSEPPEMEQTGGVTARCAVRRREELPRAVGLQARRRYGQLYMRFQPPQLMTRR